MTTTPKANGTATPKSAKEPATKSAKPKAKKPAAKEKSPEQVVPKEPELSPEEKRQKKEVRIACSDSNLSLCSQRHQKEVLFLRHKLQKGLLSKEQTPKEDEMGQMAEFITKLEGYADLEVSIIRLTKINKVLKAIIKLPSIPKEEEYKFKDRSQTLLDKWNTLLAIDTPSAATNGGGDAQAEGEDNAGSADSAPKATNGVKADEKSEDVVMEDAEKKSDADQVESADVKESKVS